MRGLRVPPALTECRLGREFLADCGLGAAEAASVTKRVEHLMTNGPQAEADVQAVV